MASERSAVEAVADVITAIDLGRPIRVAIDGIIAAGKTTFSENLVKALARRGRRAIHISMNGFHNPSEVRYEQGRYSADGYYEDAYDFAALRREVIEPLGPGGNRRYRTAIIDLESDTPIDEPPQIAEPDDVFLVDGSFLQRREMQGAWDLIVYIHASFETAEARGAARDAETPEEAEEILAGFRKRYHAAQRRYLAECMPSRNADLVIDAEDVENLRFLGASP